ncbi:hypothetical protein T4D_7469 [Trichinella pseudospiralis]|uniref:Uncharacterized protein n=1 Tax=Trichinella pseudospiralis TaxID=6337 RepID=A0A0V1FFX7_TRIPS|nr:hypothetical protein T4D_7469 [Trichinella pseudospiralis]
MAYRAITSITYRLQKGIRLIRVNNINSLLIKIQWNSVITMGFGDRDFYRYNRVCILILIYFYRNSRDIVITQPTSFDLFADVDFLPLSALVSDLYF